eukprot:m.78110 g.78110  ORF g.78110 m.78110 type:complete len:142 (+) comp25079_c0_seq1:157-582(+)
MHSSEHCDATTIALTSTIPITQQRPQQHNSDHNNNTATSTATLPHYNTIISKHNSNKPTATLTSLLTLYITLRLYAPTLHDNHYYNSNFTTTIQITPLQLKLHYYNSNYTTIIQTTPLHLTTPTLQYYTACYNHSTDEAVV